MSAQDVYSELASNNNRLLETMLTNNDLCSTVMGLLGRIIYSAQVEMNKPVAGISMGQLIVEGAQFRSQVHFADIATARPSLWHPRRDFAEYTRMKAGRMAQALADNHHLGEFFEKLVSAIAQYAEHKGIPFPALRFTKRIITRDWKIVLEVGRVHATV